MLLKNQERARSILEKLYEKNRVPNGLVFYGYEGVGKTVAALDFAKGLLCLNSKVWGCDECVSCKHMNRMIDAILKDEVENLKVYDEKDGRKVFLYLAGDHPDFIFIPPHGNNVKIDQIRGLKDFAYIKPALSRRKVIVIDKADMMTKESANALLKVLEEPPLDTHIILITTEKDSLLPTILSRTFHIEFLPLDKQTFFQVLGTFDEELYKLSEGSVTKAKVIKENRKILEYVKDILSDDPERKFNALQKVDDLESEEKRVLLHLLEIKLRELLYENKISPEKYEVLLRRISELRDGIQRGVKMSLGLLVISEYVINY